MRFERFDLLIEQRIPYLISLGALDMVNFGARESVPEKYQHRNLYVHNAQVTLMRTNAEENRLAACWIADKLNQATAPWTLVIPEGGISALDAPGQPFHDPEADAILFDALESKLEPKPERRIVRSADHINAPEFARAIIQEFEALWKSDQ